VLPTDTVYGLCADPHRDSAAGEIYRLKQRPIEQPLALLAKDVQVLLELVPELPRAALEALLPGPYTLVLPNPEQRFRWLTGSAPETIGVRALLVHALDDAAPFYRKYGFVSSPINERTLILPLETARAALP